jgi:hypothetical protein
MNKRIYSRVRQSTGYIQIFTQGHPVADKRGYVYEHRLVAEKAIGRYLSRKNRVHHVNGVRHENQNTNLVICEDDAYHHLLHFRQQAFRATGSVHAVKCSFCKQYGFHEKDNMATVKRTNGAFGNSYHRSCANAATSAFYYQNREHINAKRRVGATARPDVPQRAARPAGVWASEGH